MKLRTLVLTVSAALTLAMTGCSTSPTNAQIGTGVGAVAGGVAGEALFGGTLGTLGGAAAGALIGNEVPERGRCGQREDRQDGDRRHQFDQREAASACFVHQHFVAPSAPEAVLVPASSMVNVPQAASRLSCEPVGVAVAVNPGGVVPAFGAVVMV